MSDSLWKTLPKPVVTDLNDSLTTLNNLHHACEAVNDLIQLAAMNADDNHLIYLNGPDLAGLISTLGQATLKARTTLSDLLGASHE